LKLLSLPDGFETSSSGISSSLYHLANNKDVQSKLRDEINKAFVSPEDFNYDNIMNLEYLDQVWNGKDTDKRLNFHELLSLLH
jgi:hypothetical protein